MEGDYITLWSNDAPHSQKSRTERCALRASRSAQERPGLPFLRAVGLGSKRYDDRCVEFVLELLVLRLVRKGAPKRPHPFVVVFVAHGVAGPPYYLH